MGEIWGVTRAGGYANAEEPVTSGMTSKFRSTLWRVLVIQAVALAMLWLLQSRYTP